MSVEAFIHDLRRRGVQLRMEGEDIRFRAPIGVVTTSDRQRLALDKPTILAILGGVLPVRGGRDKGSADRRHAAGSGTPSQISHNSRKVVPAHPVGPDDGACLPSRRAVAVGPGDGVVDIGGRSYPYFAWDGRTLDGAWIGFDTETAMIVEHEVPPLALASVSSGDEHCLIHPARLGEFVKVHRDRHLVFHNVAFDFWVVAEHLASCGKEDAATDWWAIADADRMHDTMILDQLIRLARTDAHPRPRNLAEVAMEYAGMAVNKLDPFRLRYGEIIGRDWAGVERGFCHYAIKDPIVTLAAYRAMREQAAALMEAHGHDPSRCD